MLRGFLGKKIGMSQIFRDDGRVVPVTVIEAGPCIVVQVKTQETDGYEAVQLRVAEDYIDRFGQLAQKTNTLVLPANVADVGSMLTLAMNIIKRQGPGGDRGAA